MSRFTKSEDGKTVTDTLTGLVWSQNTVASDVTFEDAVKAVAELGEGWRLPTVDELQTIVDRTKYDPAIDTDAFPDTESDWYWTSTPWARRPESARWVVHFYNGNVNSDVIYGEACVRAVRGGQ
ncbi:DUF1566 domain-containing protein [Rheinheimera soli]|uniref:Lcl C-terminal domain-containing protein n=1 Tax=Rheinheimera soli TaxID=443616 RepID=A0ABU1VVH2_9GAMM|nr:DUF1566 domain-containing protein [Rheinheimera soli]MDR7119721.1 hypothetical protein [Rheinheimera soli]